MKTHSVAFISKRLKDDFELLKGGRFEDKELYASIDKALDALKGDPLCGIKIKQKLWPKEFVAKFQITNLWKLNLPHGWRLIYTTEADEVRVVGIVLEWLSHKEYERRFGY